MVPRRPRLPVLAASTIAGVERLSATNGNPKNVAQGCGETQRTPSQDYPAERAHGDLDIAAAVRKIANSDYRLAHRSRAQSSLQPHASVDQRAGRDRADTGAHRQTQRTQGARSVDRANDASVPELRLPLASPTTGSHHRRWAQAVLAVALLLISAPALALTAFAVRMTGRPVLVRQLRQLPDGSTIRCWQFRTGAVAPPGNLRTAEFTELGRWLDGTGLGQLPALFDVAAGRMVFTNCQELLSSPHRRS